VPYRTINHSTRNSEARGITGHCPVAGADFGDVSSLPAKRSSSNLPFTCGARDCNVAESVSMCSTGFNCRTIAVFPTSVVWNSTLWTGSDAGREKTEEMALPAAPSNSFGGCTFTMPAACSALNIAASSSAPFTATKR